MKTMTGDGQARAPQAVLKRTLAVALFLVWVELAVGIVGA
jgi:hypothetical protein